MNYIVLFFSNLASIMIAQNQTTYINGTDSDMSFYGKSFYGLLTSEQ